MRGLCFLILGFLRWDFISYVDEPGGGGGGDPAWHESADWGGGEDAYVPSDKVKEFGGVSDLAKAYDNAHHAIQQKGILIPGENASDEEGVAFKSSLREHLGISVPDEYSWKPPEGMEDDFDTEGLTSHFDKWREAGMSDEHVSMIMGAYTDTATGLREQMAEAQKTMKAESDTKLKEAWGDKFDENMGMVAKQQERYGDAMEKLKAVGLGNDSDILKMFHDVSLSTREDTPAGEGGKGGSEGIDDQITALKQTDAYKNGRHQDHGKVFKQIQDLQKQAVKK